jgi:hypothetical protein
VPVALTPERHDECRRDEELKQRATEEGDGFAAKGEDQMAGLVDREIEAVQPAVVGWCPETLPSVDRQDQRERGAPVSFPDGVLACVLQMSSAVCLPGPKSDDPDVILERQISLRPLSRRSTTAIIRKSPLPLASGLTNG